MTKFSDFIRFPGTAGPPTRDGIAALGFVLDGDIPGYLAKYVRVDLAQTFTGGEKTQARANIGAVIGTDVQAFSTSLTSLAGLTTAADSLPYTTAADTWAVTTLTAFARTLLDDVNQAGMRTTLGLTPGTDVQAYSAALASIAGLTTAADRLPYTTASNTYAVTTLTAFARTLLDDADAATARATLGAGTGFGDGTISTTTLATTLTITGILSTTRCIVCEVSGLQTVNNLAPILIQMGSGGALVTTGYLGVGSRIVVAAAATITPTNGAGIYGNAATEIFNGKITLTQMDASTNEWDIDISVRAPAGGVVCGGGAKIILPGIPDRIAFLANSGNLVAGGKINVRQFT